jgi:hypothetical protein
MAKPLHPIYDLLPAFLHAHACWDTYNQLIITSPGLGFMYTSFFIQLFCQPVSVDGLCNAYAEIPVRMQTEVKG